MTRKEAIAIIDSAAYSVGSDSYFSSPEQVVRVLERLGLLKLEERPELPSPSMIIKDNIKGFYPMGTIVKADQIINALYIAGYKIVAK